MAKKVLAAPLTAREREIVIAAVAGRAFGTPLEATKQILAAIEVLDGKHEPILVWPEGLSKEERAAWHEGQATYWREASVRWAECLSHSAASVGGALTSSRTGAPTGEVETPLPDSV